MTSTSGEQVRCVWRGRVGELAQLLGQPSFYASCVQRYEAANFGSISDAEHHSWHRSWPPLVDVLLRAGLGKMQIYLEYGTPGGAGRFDALLLGKTKHGTPALIVVELKQWTETQVLSDRLVRRSDGMEVSHPVVQVAAYLAFIREWFEAGSATVTVRGLVFLHNATSAEVKELQAGPQPDPSNKIPVLSGEDLGAGVPRKLLAQRLLAADLHAPGDHQITKFERTRWAPTRRLLDSVADMLESARSFTLIGDQQEAFLRIKRAVNQAKQRRERAVITVMGGPGSGKTVIATRLLAYLARQPGLEPRYVSPSGTLIAQLREAAGDRAAADLFLLPREMITHAIRGSRITVLDEGQRFPRPDGGRLLQQIMSKVPILLLFLDERQIIRPNEGFTVEEIRQMASAYGAAVHHLTLAGCFRCNGSRAYANWVDQLLYDTPQQWAGGDFDFALADDPAQLQAWIDYHTVAGARARTAAGFCWPWNRDRSTLRPEVAIRWIDATGQQRLWEAPWNAAKAMGTPPLAPHRNFWATHPGGHRQIGCIYTAQGLEYEYGGVIIGPDLVYRDGTWQARPGESHDDALKGLPPHQYLPLALNIYRVLLTRSTRATRIYSTDPETRAFLASLLKSHQPEQARDGSGVATH
ncbi:DNA/RNA helicase domain-containing protein [Actinomadura alba]|uniref:DUF2075 domain-containing protein n=1 Tax=Actinomadura alba TaxID=406431 RepID=A0ABR7LVS0_9ACTN|nr:DNA/RNA helicase domain-containing protein [Actinomadura alba]MBC6468674.1 DUF2075 domain-containing protein [Actinomadura alba]